MSVETLSPAQQKIYDLLRAGKDRIAIVRELGLTIATFNAQCTRIRNKGLAIPNEAGQTPRSYQPTRQDIASGRSHRPPATGATSSQAVMNEAAGAGPAVYDVEATIKAAQARGELHGDMAAMHPMAIMGITIQFMRLCGGRFHAHQIIEDIYGAVRLLTADGPSADQVVENATKPFSGKQLSEDDLNQFLNKVEGVKDELQDMIEKATGGFSLQAAQTP